MNSRSRGIDAHAEATSAGTPLACPRQMPNQALTAWTPATVIGALLMTLLAVPRAVVRAPAVIRRRA